ncbi:MAG: amidohydrolase family protein [Williamsia herbipolensis]|nr:amidohydrolase family protein [Williamsia herbipolensis]
MSRALLLRNARIGGGSDIGDVLTVDGVVRSIGAPLDGSAVAVLTGPDAVVEDLDLDGRTVLPGFWDHHVHFDQWSLSRRWIDLTSAHDPESAVELVRAAIPPDVPEHGLPLVGYGWTDGLWTRPPHRTLLDALDTPAGLAVVLVSNDLHAAWLNAAALRRYGLPPDGDGVVREEAWFPIMADIRSVPSSLMDRWADDAARAAATRGVVGIVDFETADNLAAWTRRIVGGSRSLRISAAVWPEHLEAAIARGLRTSDPVPGTDGLLRLGPLKVITDGSLNTRTAFCHDPYPNSENSEHPFGMLVVPSERLVPLMARAHGCGIASAIHAIGDHANALVLDAFAETGARGVIEHAQLLARSDFERFAALGVGASVQPEHAMDDRDVADRHWAGRTDRAFAYGDLHRAGARLTLGSDAPVAPLDPLVTLAAAISRSRDGRPAWHPDQEIGRDVALAASTGTGRARPGEGDQADLVILDVDVATADAETIRTAPVAGTVLAGRWTHRSGL